MIISLALLYFSNFVLGKKEYVTVSGKSTRSNIVDLGRWRIPLTILVSLFALIVVVIPFATVILTSFTKNMDKSLLADGNFTLQHWETVFNRKAIRGSAMNSLLYAVLAATFGMIVCLIMAYLLKRTRAPGRKIPDFLITLGSGTPSVVIALALIMTMSGKFFINIYNTWVIMVIAYMIKYMLMGMRTVVSGFSQISPSLEEAAQVSGSGWLRRLRDVVLPSVVAGWFLIFMPCFYELSMSNLLYSTNTKVLGVELYTYQTYHSQQTASALTSAILLLVAIVNIILSKTTKGKFSI